MFNRKLTVCVTVVCCSLLYGINEGACVPAGEKGFCKPGGNYDADDGCNKCTCNSDGTGPESCTLLMCEKAVKTIKRKYCEPNQFFTTTDKCYWCLCDAAGKSGLCSPLVCGKSPDNFQDR